MGQGSGAKIILVGVVHGDPDGYVKLKRFFQQSKPRVISVEISEYSRRFRRRREGRWQGQFQKNRALLPEELRRHAALEKVAAQIAEPFEIRAAEDYARVVKIAWQAVDIGSVAQEHLPRYEAELLSKENFLILVSTPDGGRGEQIRQEYRRARGVLEGGRGSVSDMWAGAASPQVRLREKVLAHRVARLAREWKSVVHVGGWEHLRMSGPQKTMADYLAAWKPERVLLDMLVECPGLRTE